MDVNVVVAVDGVEGDPIVVASGSSETLTGDIDNDSTVTVTASAEMTPRQCQRHRRIASHHLHPQQLQSRLTSRRQVFQMSLIRDPCSCTLVSTVWPRSRRSGNRNSPQVLMKEALSDESGLDGRSLYAHPETTSHERSSAESARRQLSEGKALVIADLAKEAGVSVATVYNHFDGPEAILKAITEDLVNRSIADASSLVQFKMGHRRTSYSQPFFTSRSVSQRGGKPLRLPFDLPG